MAALPNYQEIAAGLAPSANSPSPNLGIYLYAEIQVGVCLQEAGQWKASADHLTRVLRFQNDELGSYWCQIHAVAAESYIKGGLLDLARPHVEAALDLAQRALEDHLGEQQVWINRVGYAEAQLVAAKYFLASYHFDPAKKYLEDLLAVRFQDGGPAPGGVLGRAWTLLGTTHYQLHFQGVHASDEPALTAYQSALDSKGGLNDRDAFTCHTRMAQLHLESERFDQAETHLQALVDHLAKNHINTYDRAWYYSLLNRLLRERDGKAEAEFPPAYLALINQWKEQTRAGGVAYLRYGRIREIASEGILQGLGEGGPETAIEVMFRFQEIGFLDQQLRPKQTHLNDLRTSLAADELCLLFMTGKHQMHAFAVAREGEVDYWSAPYSFAISDAIASLTALLFSEDVEAPALWEEQVYTKAENLRNHLFPPGISAKIAACQRLRICGREHLRDVPLEVFSFGGKPLGLSHSISDWPTIPVGLALEARRAEPSSTRPQLDMTLVANPKFHADLQLPSTAPLSVPYPKGDRIRVLEGKAATYTAWLQTPDSYITHFLTHSLLQDKAEWQTAIALAPDERLATGLLDGMQILQEPNWNASPLSILSICQSQRSDTRQGDAGSGRLGGVFLGRGSYSVLASRGDANVYLDAAWTLHKSVYQKMSKGARLDDAVRFARNALAQDGKHQSPSHWAAWQIIGLGSLTLPIAPAEFPETKRTSSPPWLEMVGAATLFVLVLIGLARRRRKQTRAA